MSRRPAGNDGPGRSGSAASAGVESCDGEEGCITCGDLADELLVLEIDETRGLALCRDRVGRRRSVETALVLPVEAGDRLLVHAGTAISKAAA